MKKVLITLGLVGSLMADGLFYKYRNHMVTRVYNKTNILVTKINGKEYAIDLKQAIKNGELFTRSKRGNFFKIFKCKEGACFRDNRGVKRNLIGFTLGGKFYPKYTDGVYVRKNITDARMVYGLDGIPYQIENPKKLNILTDY